MNLVFKDTVKPDRINSLLLLIEHFKTCDDNRDTSHIYFTLVEILFLNLL